MDVTTCMVIRTLYD